MRGTGIRGSRRWSRPWRHAIALLVAMAALAPAAAGNWATPPGTGPGPRGIAIDDAGYVFTANFGSTGTPGARR
jgi:hypothetical protein